MRELVVIEFVTLDGVMQGLGSADEDREGGFELGTGKRLFREMDRPRRPGMIAHRV